MTARIDDLMSQAIALAREQHGEREYTYRRVLHSWHSSRKRGQKGSWYSTIGIDPVTREDYEANRAQGKADSFAALRGELNKTRYYDYWRDKERDGWQDALIAIIEEVPE